MRRIYTACNDLFIYKINRVNSIADLKSIFRETESKNDMKEFHVLFVPRKSHLCEKKLKELGVYGSFKNNVKEFFLDLIPLDFDLLSMENIDLYRVSKIRL